jgi:hypothetical protein
VLFRSNIKIYDEAKTLKKEAKTNKLSTADVPDRGELEVDALDSKNLAVKLKVNKANKGEIILDDFGKKNPIQVPLPGMAVKCVEIGASGISFSSADITIRYTDAELNGGSEDALTIYHWNGASWDAVPTTIDMVNKTISASTASLSVWGVATPYQKALRCDTGTSIGVSDTTDTNCATASYTVFSTGLLLDPAGTTGGYIQFTAFTGERLYGYFVDNTAYSTDVNITGVNGSMSMARGTTAITAYGKYQVGYYDPNGAADNFVGLFNSTDTSGATTTTATKFPVSFYAANNTAIIPKNMKLAIRVWTRVSASGQARFYLYRTTAGYGSLINYTIAAPAVPNITSWSNNRTNDTSTSISIYANEAVKFNATADQGITTWNWYRDNVSQSNNFDNYSTSWSALGVKTVSVNATNANGTSNTVTWAIDVVTNVTVQGQVDDKNLNPLNAHIKTYKTKGGNPSHSQTGSAYNFNDVPTGGYVLFDANDTKIGRAHV